MKRDDILRYLTLAISAIALFATLLSLSSVIQASSLTITALVIVMLLATLASFGAQLIRDQIANPTTLTISLLGYPSSGKTVYLTVLFNELATKIFTGFVFSPYGSETIEQVTRDLNQIMLGQWLVPTPPNSVFYYRAYATNSTGFLRKKYKIEIGDYAGEHFDTLGTPEQGEWLHKSEYFKYVIQSEVIVLAIDTRVLVEQSDRQISVVENGVIAAMQLLISEKRVDVSRKMRAPIALVFMKSDLVPVTKHPIYEQRLSRLITFCKNHCYNFKVFWTSSVGEVGPENDLLGKIHPQGVAEPILWAIRRV